MRLLRLALIFCVGLVARGEEAEAEKLSDVIVLTDANFEKLTQAASGSTTGDWFVKFYAPWCGHCKSMAPTWENVATELKGVLNVGKIDCTVNRDTCDRFGATSYPRLLLLHGGMGHRFGGQRTLEDLKKFATESYTEVTPTRIPREMNTWELLAKKITQKQKELQKHKPILMVPCIVSFVVGILVTIPVTLMVSAIAARMSGPKKSKQA